MASYMTCVERFASGPTDARCMIDLGRPVRDLRLTTLFRLLHSVAVSEDRGPQLIAYALPFCGEAVL